MSPKTDVPVRCVQWECCCKDFLDFQLRRLVFFAIVREIRSRFLCLTGRLSTSVRLPNEHSDGDWGILQLRIEKSFSTTVVQKERTGEQVHGMKVIISATQGELCALCACVWPFLMRPRWTVDGSIEGPDVSLRSCVRSLLDIYFLLKTSLSGPARLLFGVLCPLLFQFFSKISKDTELPRFQLTAL